MHIHKGLFKKLHKKEMLYASLFYRMERTALFKIIVIIEIKIDATIARPNESMWKPSRKFSVSINTPALITNKNKPNVKIVIGSVNIINKGFTRTFKIDKINPASKAV